MKGKLIKKSKQDEKKRTLRYHGTVKGVKGRSQNNRKRKKPKRREEEVEE